MKGKIIDLMLDNFKIVILKIGKKLIVVKKILAVILKK